MANVNAVPDGFRTVTPHLSASNAAAAIDFYKQAFGAEEIMRMPAPGGKGIMHAEIKIGDSIIMLNDEFPQSGCAAPTTLKGTTAVMHLYVKDCDAQFKRAVAAGAKTVMPPADMFWGDRYCQVSDAWGHLWSIATHVKDPTPEEMKAAMAAFGAGCKP